MKTKFAHAAMILALGLAIGGCGANDKTGGNQNTGNPANSTQSGGSGGTSGTPTTDSQKSGGQTGSTNAQSATQNAPSDAQAIMVEMTNSQKMKAGTAEITPSGTGLSIKLNLTGLTSGQHGIHIHQQPVCEAPDFKTAGDHFNPEQKQHGTDNPNGPHAGDLPNIEADANGNVNTVIKTDMATFASSKTNSLLEGNGKALVIHAKADDHKTDPSGNSGDRVACGVIKPNVNQPAK